MRPFLILCLSIIALHLWIARAPLIAQSSDDLSDFEPRFERFDLPDGRNHVLKMHQDSTGFLWFASHIGLVRYDGLRFITFPYDSLNENSPANNDLEYIYEDRQGIFWLAHWRGFVTSFDPKLEIFTRYPLPDSLRSKFLVTNCIIEDSEEYLWIGTKQGLYRFDPARKYDRHFLHKKDDPNSLSHNDVKELYVDSDGVLWIGAGFPLAEDDYPSTNLQSDYSGGLHRYRPETDDFERFVHDPNNPLSLRDERISAIFEDSNQEFWVGAWGDGLHKMDRTSGAFEHFPYDPLNPDQLSLPFQRDVPVAVQTQNHVPFIGEDHKKRLWIGSWGAGLTVYDPASAKTKRFENEPGDAASLPTNFIWDFYETKEGVIWFCNGGINWIFKANEKADQFSFHDMSPFLNNRVLDFTCVMEDDAGNIWLGAPGAGLIQFDPNSKQIINEYQYAPNDPYSLSSNDVTGIRQDREDGSIWASTTRGLNHLNPKTGKFRRYQYDPKEPGSLQYYSGFGIRPIFQDSAGAIWVATGQAPKGGLHLLDRQAGQFKNFTYDSKKTGSIGNNWVLAIHEDQKNNLWVGGARFLDRYQRQTGIFEHFDLPERIKGVKEIASDANGKIWFRSMTNELGRLDPVSGSIKLFARANSLIPVDKIYSLLKSRDSRIWMRSENALLALNPLTEDFQLFPPPPDLSPDLFYYGVVKEYQLYESSFVNSAGTIFFPERGGYYAFHPDSLQVQEDQNPPKIILSELIIGDKRIVPGEGSLLKKPIWETKAIRLAHDQNSFSLAIACIDYRKPEANQLKFRLDNYDQDWRTDHQDGLAVYNPLPPGKYVFRARGANSDGIWNEDGVYLNIRIAPPWWKTIWAYALFIVLGLGIIFIIFRFQLNRKMAKAEAQRLRELDQVKNRLYTNITHEFRTPLTIISGMAEQIEENPKNKKRLTEGLDMIKRNSNKLLSLVNQILDLRKMESGSMSVHFQQGDIIVFLRYILDSFHSYAAGKNIRLHFISDLESFTMDFDSDKTLKIVSNLLSNAIKFTKKDGDVYVSVRNLARNSASLPKSDWGEASEVLEIQVKDTGIGISEDQLPRIFDRFYQADDQLMRQAEGTGVGLALTRELVKLLRGEIAVKSRLGEGAVFSVYLPVSREAAPAEKPMSIGKQVGGFMTQAVTQNTEEIAGSGLNEEIPLVLIVEDNKDVVRYLRSCLAKDYRLEVAGNGREGVDKALEIIPDMIISDVMMPGMDGYTLCQTLKEDERSNHIPIILLTAKADHVSKIEGLQRGADAYLSKPFNREELQIRLQQLIALRRRLQARYNSGNFKIEAATQQEDEFVLKVRRLILERLDDDGFSIPQLSRELRINRVHLHRKIKALTGKTAAHFIRHIRLQEARRLLLNSDLNISEIAYEAGFKDPAYFTRVFTEVFGESPSAMRDRLS